jgi:HSP20 family protein
MSTTLVPFTRSRLPDLFGDFDRDLNRLMGFFNEPNGNAEMTAWSPRVNLAETENEYLVTVDLPGLDRDDIHVEMKQGDLWITGERKHEVEQSGQNWHRMESSFGSFRRMIRLGEHVDSSHINAEYKDGVLRITVPKVEAAKPHRIEVR